MKKKILSAIMFTVALVSLSVLVGGKFDQCRDLTDGEVESVASCEISHNGKTIYECSGEEGECTATYHRFTLSCSGGRNE